MLPTSSRSSIIRRIWRIPRRMRSSCFQPWRRSSARRVPVQHLDVEEQAHERVLEVVRNERQDVLPRRNGLLGLVVKLRPLDRGPDAPREILRQRQTLRGGSAAPPRRDQRENTERSLGRRQRHQQERLRRGPPDRSAAAVGLAITIGRPELRTRRPRANSCMPAARQPSVPGPRSVRCGRRALRVPLVDPGDPGARCRPAS